MRTVGLTVFGLFVAGCNPMYVAGPAPTAIFHQQKDVAAFVSGGLHGVGGGVGVALTDNLAVRIAGGYRPWKEGENGYGLAGVTGFLSLRRDGFRTGPDRNSNGFRGALSADFGGGGGLGNSVTLNIFGSSGTTINRFSGNYFQGQIQADAGYEWPVFLLLGTARVSIFNFRTITAAYVEPSISFRVGAPFLRFGIQAGLSIPVTGNTDGLGGVQPFIISAVVSGLLELEPKPATPDLEPPNVVPIEAPGPPPPPPLTAPPLEQAPL